MTRKRKALWAVACLVVVAVTGFSVWLRLQEDRWLAFSLHGHQHCIKATAIAFSSYAGDHGGKYPTHTNGWGDALLLLVKSNYADISLICGPNDDGRVFREALEKGTDVPEELCSRVYVQGLSKDKANGVLILFDRVSFPGGDHFYGLKEPIREGLEGDGSTSQINDKLWLRYSREQVTKLMELGFSREQAAGYFPDAKER